MRTAAAFLFLALVVPATGAAALTVSWEASVGCDAAGAKASVENAPSGNDLGAGHEATLSCPEISASSAGVNVELQTPGARANPVRMGVALVQWGAGLAPHPDPIPPIGCIPLCDGVPPLEEGSNGRSSGTNIFCDAPQGFAGHFNREFVCVTYEPVVFPEIDPWIELASHGVEPVAVAADLDVSRLDGARFESRSETPSLPAQAPSVRELPRIAAGRSDEVPTTLPDVRAPRFSGLGAGRSDESERSPLVGIVDETTAGLRVEATERTLDPATTAEMRFVPSTLLPRSWRTELSGESRSGIEAVETLFVPPVVSVAIAGLGAVVVGWLYHRIRPDEALRHPSREALLRVVAESPGSEISQLAARMGVHRTTLRHHLFLLDQAGYVQTIRTPRAVRVFAAGVRDPQSRAHELDATDSPLARAIVRERRAHPEFGVRALSRSLGTDPASVRYHLRRLAAAGLAEERREGPVEPEV